MFRGEGVFVESVAFYCLIFHCGLFGRSEYYVDDRLSKTPICCIHFNLLIWDLLTKNSILPLRFSSLSSRYRTIQFLNVQLNTVYGAKESLQLLCQNGMVDEIREPGKQLIL